MRSEKLAGVVTSTSACGYMSLEMGSENAPMSSAHDVMRPHHLGNVAASRAECGERDRGERPFHFFLRVRQAVLNSLMVSIVRGFHTILRKMGGVIVGMCAPASSASLTS